MSLGLSIFPLISCLSHLQISKSVLSVREELGVWLIDTVYQVAECFQVSVCFGLP